MLLLLPTFGLGQKASIRFQISNARAKEVDIIVGGYAKAARLFKGEGEFTLPLKNAEANWSYQLTKPAFVSVYYREPGAEESVKYLFYLSPGDDLRFSFDASDPEASFRVTGKGSQNNQPAIQDVFNNPLKLNTYKKDSLPYPVFTAILQRDSLNKINWAKYVLAHQPAQSLQEIMPLYLRYFPVFTYVTFKGDQKFNIREPYYRNESSWLKLEDSLVKANPLNVDALLDVDAYAYFLSNYLRRLKESLWQHPEWLKTYYHTDTQEEAVMLKIKDPENILREKIIEKHFSGRTAEFLYGVIFSSSMQEKHDNLPAIFDRFKLKYPNSDYIPMIERDIELIRTKMKRQLTDKMVFVENPDKYQSLSDVLQLVKGKTVLLDMWGTWCGPCRTEIIAHAAAIKAHFKHKPVAFMYIANHDIGNEKQWKELIAYYQLTGLHLMASPALTKDIMDKVKGTGFPTYVVIKKDGTFELSKADFPMKRAVLIAQIEEALRN